jgi:2-dehydropantoate 2-reductase
MKFVIMGSGGVGGYFGAKLAAAGYDVRFVARGKHLDAMKSHGLLVQSAQEKIHIESQMITGNVADIGIADVILFCVKSYDTENATRMLSPALNSESVVICLQNGIDNEDKIRQIIPAGTVYGGVAYVYSTITAPGKITRFEGPAKIVFGPFKQPLDERSHKIHEIFQKAGVSADLSSSIETELWKKFIFITGASGITALTRLALGELLANVETRALIKRAMEETRAVALAKGIVLDAHLIDSFFETLGKFKNDTRSSLYYDLENKKPMEIEALAGTVIKLGKEAGVPTPLQETIYAALIPYHRKHSQAAGLTRN